MAPADTARPADVAEPDLLAAAQRGDQAAFERLVASYRRQLHGSAGRRPGRHHG